MIYCKECGTENDNNSNFCLKCGTELKNKLSIKKPEFKFELPYIIFLERANGYRIGDNFPGYFKYEYGVDPNSLLEKAVDNNHLIESNVFYRLERSTVKDLKESLKKHDLKVSGRKIELIQRIKDNCTVNIIKHDFTYSYYILTSEGNNLVQENDHIVYYHKSQYLRVLSLEEYHELLKEKNKINNILKYDMALKLLDEYATKERINGNWGLYRNSLLSKASVFKDKEDYLDSLEHYLKVINIDLSGLNNNNMYWPKFCMLFPGLMPEIIKLIRYLDLDDNKLEKIYFSCAKELKIPKSAFTNIESFKYLIQAINGDVEEANSIIKNKTSKM
jgi:hypothetical protein